MLYSEFTRRTFIESLFLWSTLYRMPRSLFFSGPFRWSFHERLHKGPFQPRYWEWKGHTGTLPWKLKRLALWWQLAASSDIFPSTFGNFSFSCSYCLMFLCSTGDHHVHGPKCLCVCVIPVMKAAEHKLGLWWDSITWLCVYMHTHTQGANTFYHQRYLHSNIATNSATVCVEDRKTARKNKWQF